MRKIIKTLLISFVLMLSVLYCGRTFAYEVYDNNNPGSGYAGTSQGASGQTYWPGNGLQAIRIRIFRNGSSIKSGYFSLANSKSNCVGHTIAKLCENSEYENKKVSDFSGKISCNARTTIYFNGCLFENGLDKNWYVDSGVWKTDGTKIANYFKNTNYKNLKEVLKGIGYNETNFNDNDIVIVEPATVVLCDNISYFGTSTALIGAKVSYNKSLYGTVCKKDNYSMGAFVSLYPMMANALKSTSNSCYTSSIYNSERKKIDDNYSGCGYFQYNVKDLKYVIPDPIYTLTITKQNEEGVPVPNVTFKLDGKECETNNQGNCTISGIKKGTYTLTESFISSANYTLKSCNDCTVNSNGTMSVTITGNKSITVVNERSCGQKLSELKKDGRKPTKSELVSLYTSEFSKGNNYTNLLNFSNPSCSVANCSYTSPSSCLNASYSDNSFNEDNWSCYNKKIEKDYKPGFCQTSFSLTPSTSYSNNSSGVKSGQMYFNISNGILATGNLNQICYFVDLPNMDQITNGKVSDYLKNVTLSENLVLEQDNELKLTKSGNTYSGAISFNYLLPEVCVKNITGRPIACGSLGNKSLGYGILSKFTDSGTNSLNFSMTFDIDNNTLFKDNSAVNEINYDSACNYTSTPEIVKNNKLQLEFRIIDTDYPFPGRSGEGRTPNTNWNKVKNNCSYSNLYIGSQENSYGIIPNTKEIKDTPKYRINLTSDVIAKIINYNEEHNYDDYNFTCEEDKCTSNFLAELKEGKVDGQDVNTRLEIPEGYEKQETCLANILESEEILYLDFNGDGKVTSEDVEYVLMYTFFPEDYPLTQQGIKNADRNKDGKITTEDVAALREIIISQIEKPCKLDLNDGSIDRGDLITCGTESFYTIYSDNETVTMLTEKYIEAKTNNPKQTDNYSRNKVEFSQNRYWSSSSNENFDDEKYAYVYSSSSLVYPYLQAYKSTLSSIGLDVLEIRLINYKESAEIRNILINIYGYPSSSLSSSSAYWAGFVVNLSDDVPKIVSSNGFVMPCLPTIVIYGSSNTVSEKYLSAIKAVITIPKFNIE